MGARIVIMAGGTGGHVFPALAVARALRERGVSVSWIGTHQGIEAKLVPAADIEMDWITVAGLRHKGWSNWLVAPWRIGAAITQALGILRRRQPGAVLGMGGFAAGPGGVASRLLGIPLVIHEQNAIAGLTNRLLAPLAKTVLQAFPGAFSASHPARVVGNPVRREIVEMPSPVARFAGRAGNLRLLVVGGSLGAQALNELVPAAVALMPTAAHPQIWHQCGKGNDEATQRRYTDNGIEARTSQFIDDMAAAYAWADLVICRAGALTISELAAAGLPALLVPYPHAVDDHQTANARYLVNANAAELLPQAELNAQMLARILGQYASGRDGGVDRERLLNMATAARGVANPASVERVVDACLEAAHV